MKTLLSFSTLSALNIHNEAQSTSGDRVVRCFTLESLIPSFPGNKSITELRIELVALGFDCSAKTIRRDMDLLSCLKPIVCNEDAKPKRYSLQR